MLTSRQAADRLRVTPRTLQRWAAKGIVKSEKTPYGRVYKEEDILEIIGRQAK